jgi:hypothetical protein
MPVDRKTYALDDVAGNCPGICRLPRHGMSFDSRIYVLDDVAAKEPVRCCSPHHGMPFNTRNDAWRGTFACPHQSGVGIFVVVSVHSRGVRSGEAGARGGGGLRDSAEEVEDGCAEVAAWRLQGDRVDLERLRELGPGRYRSPRHRRQFNSINEGLHRFR